jgi:hypothetical protein
MTPEEAQKVAAIITTADDGCPTCVGWLTAEFVQAFPEHNWLRLVRAAVDGRDKRAVTLSAIDGIRYHRRAG